MDFAEKLGAPPPFIHQTWASDPGRGSPQEPIAMQPSGQGEWYVTYHRPHTVIATPMVSCVDPAGVAGPDLVNEGGPNF